MPKFDTLHVKVDLGKNSRRTIYEHGKSCVRSEEKTSSSDNPASKSTVWHRLGHKNNSKSNASDPDPASPTSTKPTVWQRLGHKNTSKPNASHPVPATSVELAVRPMLGKSRFRIDRRTPLSESSSGKLTARERLGHKKNKMSNVSNPVPSTSIELAVKPETIHDATKEEHSTLITSSLSSQICVVEDVVKVDKILNVEANDTSLKKRKVDVLGCIPQRKSKKAREDHCKEPAKIGLSAAEPTVTGFIDKVEVPTVQLVDKVVDNSGIPFSLATPWVLDVSWQTCNPINDAYSDIRQKAVDLAGPNYAIIGPYNPSFASNEFKPFALHPEDPLAMTAACMRRLGFKLIVGKWNIPGSPTAILLDVASSQDICHYGRQLISKMGIDISWDDGLANYATIFGLLAGNFIHIFRNVVDQKAPGCNIHTPVVVHFHEWTSALGLLFMADVKVTERVVTSYTSHQTPIEEYWKPSVAAFNIDWIKHRTMIHKGATHTTDAYASKLPKTITGIADFYQSAYQSWNTKKTLPDQVALARKAEQKSNLI